MDRTEDACLDININWSLSVGKAALRMSLKCMQCGDRLILQGECVLLQRTGGRAEVGLAPWPDLLVGWRTWECVLVQTQSQHLNNRTLQLASSLARTTRSSHQTLLVGCLPEEPPFPLFPSLLHAPLLLLPCLSWALGLVAENCAGTCLMGISCWILSTSDSTACFLLESLPLASWASQAPSFPLLCLATASQCSFKCQGSSGLCPQPPSFPFCSLP